MLRRLVVCLSLSALPCAAETLQYGNIVYELPAGWEQGAVFGGFQYLHPDDIFGTCGDCRILLSLGQPKRSGQTIEEMLEAQRTLFVDEDDRDSVEVLQPAAAMRDGDVAIAMAAHLIGGDTLQVVFAVELPDRFEIMSFQGSADNEDTLAETSAAFTGTAMTLFTGARFVSEGADPVLPPPRRGDLDGVYYGLSTSWTMGLDGMMQMNLLHRILVFWEDGHFYDGTPPTGLRPPDPAALMAMGDTDVGTYVERRGEILLTYASGETDTLERGRDVLQDGDRPMVRGEPVKDGLRIDGAVSYFSYTALAPMIGGTSSGVSGGGSVVYRKDGTWESDAYSGVAATFDTGGGFASTASSGNSGRYEVRDGLIIRVDETGAEVDRELIYRWHDDIHIGFDKLEQG